MSMITVVALFIFGLLDFISVAKEIVERKPAGGSGLKESRTVYGRRMLIHLAVWTLIIGGVLAIACFGPLRPVHEWIR